MRCLRVWGRRFSEVLGEQTPRNVPLLVFLSLAIISFGIACQSVAPESSTSSALPDTVTGVPSGAVPAATAAPSTPTIAHKPSSRVVVANLKGSSLSIVDAETQQLLETIDLMAAPHDVAVTSDGRYALYTTAEAGANKLVVFDLLGRQKAGEITVGSEPWSIILDPTGKLAFVTNHGSNTLSVVDVDRRREVANIPTGRQPRELVYVMRSGGLVYTTDFDDNAVSIVDATTRRVVGKVAVGRAPIAVATTPNGQSVYVANADDNSVSVIDVSEQAVAATLPLPGAPTDLAVSPTGQFLYITVQARASGSSNNRQNERAAHRSGGSVTATPGAEAGPSGMVVVVDPSTNQIVGHIAVAQQPASVIFGGDGTKAFVANASSNSVAVIEVGTRNVVANVDVGEEPVAMTLSEGPMLPARVASRTENGATPTPAANAQAE